MSKQKALMLTTEYEWPNRTGLPLTIYRDRMTHVFRVAVTDPRNGRDVIVGSIDLRGRHTHVYRATETRALTLAGLPDNASGREVGLSEAVGVLYADFMQTVYDETANAARTYAKAAGMTDADIE